MNRLLRRQFCRFHLDYLKMVIVANGYPVYNEGGYIAFVAWAFHITGNLIMLDVYTQDFSSHCTANIRIQRSIIGNHL